MYTYIYICVHKSMCIYIYMYIYMYIYICIEFRVYSLGAPAELNGNGFRVLGSYGEARRTYSGL